MTLKERFAQLRAQGKKAFIAYVPFGFPSIADTAAIVETLIEAGVDCVELGIPFSDPIADGPIIQAATAHALSHGATMDRLFTFLEKFRKQRDTTLALMTYFNPVMQFGLDDFLSCMKENRVSGALIVDLPVEESPHYIKAARRTGIETIFFATPVTPAQRLDQIIAVSRGFIYFISVTGTTGPQDLSYRRLRTQVQAIKKKTDTPVCVGFGIHTREQIDSLYAFCDGVIVGSHIVDYIRQHRAAKDFLKKLKNHIRSLRP